MKRTLLWLTVAFVVGIFIFSYCGIVALKNVFLGLTLIGALCFFTGKNDIAKLIAVCGIVLIFSSMYFSFRCFAFYKDAEKFDRQSAFISGKVKNIDFSEDGNIILYVNGDISARGITKSNKKFRITINDTEKRDIKYGDIINSSAKMYMPSNNLGSVDYRLYCMSKNQYLSGYTNNVNVTGSGITPLNPSDCAYGIRKKIGENIRNKINDNNEAAFASALITGNKEGLSEELAEDFTKSGISHVIAVSGTHLSILLTIAMFLFGLLKVKKRKAVIIIYIVLIWFFVLIAGCVLSVIRAALMLTLNFVSMLINRDNDSITTLSASALFILVWNPSILFDVGFLLSVASTASIIIFSEPIISALGTLPRALKNVLGVSIAAHIGAMPVSAYCFGTFATLSLAANILIYPFIAIATIASVATAFKIPYAHFIASYACKYIIYVARKTASFKFAQLPLKTPDAFIIVAYILICVAFYEFLNKKPFLRFANISLILVLITSVASIGAADVTFLNVGNGDCSIIEVYGHTVMIDSGGSKNSDIASYVIKPYLNKKGIDKIDLAFVTHFHQDHCGAFVQLMENGQVQTLVLPDLSSNREKRELLEKTASEHNTKILYASDESSFILGKDAVIESVLTSENGSADDSMLYRFTYVKTRFLFSGDVESDNEKKLRTEDIEADVLKVPHHGSDTSSSNEFIKAVNPKTAVIQVGHNSYGHPSGKVLQRYEKNQIPIFRNDLCGTITFKLGKNNIKSVRVQKEEENELRHIKKTA